MSGRHINNLWKVIHSWWRFGLQNQSQTWCSARHQLMENQEETCQGISQVRLRNGETVPLPVVKTTMLCINKMLESIPTTIALIDFVEHCRNDSTLSLSSYQICMDFALLLETGRVHDAVKAIILSSARGSNLSLRFISPIAED